MKRFITRVVVFMTISVMAITFAFADDFNWVQWLEWNGIYSVASMVLDGSMSATEACDKIIIPANQAGVLDEDEKKYLLNIVPKRNNI